ncbi:MAG: carbon-nitrogen hydrolase family protein [Candidatus Margulisiibacteriota bacterium]
MIDRLSVGLIQLNSGPDREKNMSKVLEMVQEAIHKGAEFILLPENYSLRGDNLDPLTKGESVPGPSLVPLMELARNHGVWILAGSFSEKLSNHSKVRNTSALIDYRGEMVAKYSKMHLFDVEIGNKIMRESQTFQAGEEPVLTSVKGIKTGLSICYDLRFPGLFQGYSKAGAEMICVPSSFTTPTGRSHWESLLRARAIENQAFVLAPNQVGVGARKVPTFGHSMVVGPWGEVICCGSETKEEVLVVSLDFESLRQIREQFPVLKHRKESY